MVPTDIGTILEDVPSLEMGRAEARLFAAVPHVVEAFYEFRALESSASDVFSKIVDILGDSRSAPSGRRAFFFTTPGDDMIVYVAFSNLDDHFKAENSLKFTISAHGDRTRVKHFVGKMSTLFLRNVESRIRWWYMSNGADSKFIDVDAFDIKDVNYPFLKPGANALIDTFLNQDAPLLFLSGPPGTGKTSFIRSMISRVPSVTHVTYEHALLESDTIYIQFLDDYGTGFLVIEDADELLESREHQLNKMMARFLNVSDGLIRMPKKHIVFTTNNESFSHRDEALLRPGRCFATLHFRRLTAQEGIAAAAANGLPTPNGEVSLAELFKPDAKPVEKRVIGIGR